MATRIGEIRTLRLSDGSTVTLDTDTILRTRFSASGRRLSLLRGRARFDVAHDPTRPFIVAAGGGAVAARGTLFDVALSSDQRVAVTLIRGVVEVDPASEAVPSGAARRPSIRLTQGQQFAYGRDIAAPRAEPASPTGALWPSGLLTFERAPLSHALAEANRYSRRRIVLAEPSLGALQVSGVFRAVAPHDLAEGLAAAFALRLEAAPDGDFILSRPSATASARPTG
jgi:transmembrane sensor